MKLSSKEMLLKLGQGTKIVDVCREAGVTLKEFQAWWRVELLQRVPSPAGAKIVSCSASGASRIERDEWGIPHIYADNDDGLFFAFGYAMAQDRLFQMDWLQRKGMGRLSEITGAAGLESDIAMRVIGVNRIAEAEVKLLPAETKQLLDRFSDGVNALIADSKGRLPIEFDLLGYQPEPWSPLSSCVIAGEFRWYLTVRLPVFCIPEVARRILGGDNALWRAFLEGEADEESILPRGSYAARGAGSALVGASIGDPYEGQGSNNWVLAGKKTKTGKPLLASDPHIAFAAVSCWYEVHLSGGSFNVAGVAYAGMPAIMFGRNEKLAWGITNNICAQRDIYQEKTAPERPGYFLYNGKWEKGRQVTETIKVKGKRAVTKRVIYSRNGPIIDELLPAQAKETGPVSLRWLGSTYCNWIASMQDMDRAKTIPTFRKAMDGWRVPTFSLVIAAVNGNIAYQAGGSIPERSVWERGYRPGWEPEHQWKRIIPTKGMPHIDNPGRGWIATANNRPAPNDYPYPLSGVWSSGHRARRVRQMIESKPKHDVADMVSMHQDALSLRAVDCIPGLLTALKGSRNKSIQKAAGYFEKWGARYETTEVGATLFESFFTFWTREAAYQRFSDRKTAEWVAGAMGGLATRLLTTNKAGWFKNSSDRIPAIERALLSAVADLEKRFGKDMAKWTWGRVHKIVLRHILGEVGDLGVLLNRGGQPVKGNGVTVCNTGYDPNYLAPMGANYRLVADMSTSPPSLWAVDAQGQSGHPGSQHYCDQLPEWIGGRYHRLPLETAEASKHSRYVLTFTPEKESGAST